MKQTAFVPVTILAGLAVVFLAPQWRLSAEEPPHLQQQGNGPQKERAPDRPDRGREPMHDHKQFSNEGGPIMDHLMRRFDEVITRLDRIEHRVGGGHNPNGYRPPLGPEHFGNEERMKEEGRRYNFDRPSHDRHMRDDMTGRMRQRPEMADQAHRTHEEIRERIAEGMHRSREMMEQARKRFMELNERVEELNERVEELEEEIGVAEELNERIEGLEEGMGEIEERFEEAGV